MVGTALFVAGGGVGAAWLTPANASHFKQALYPAIGSAVGLVIGAVVVFLLIYSLNFLRAPCRQRNEAWALIETLSGEEVIKILYGKAIRLCKEVQSDEEIYRVQVGVRGDEAVDNLEVFPARLSRRERGKSKQLPIAKSRLAPMADSPVNPRGETYYVNLLRHKISSPEIVLCYKDIPQEPLMLGRGEYLLQLGARGSKGEYGSRVLIIKMDTKNNISIEATPHE